MIRRIVAVAALAGGALALVPAVTASADPVPPPVITAPAGQVTGTVELAAATTATPDTGSVEFMIDGAVVGTGPITVGGASNEPNRASYQWATWGRANGTVQLTAANCDQDNVCGQPSDPIELDIENGHPQITLPLANATVRGGFTLAATAPAAFGGALRFAVDGSTYKYFVAAPYSTVFNRSLAKGWHTLAVTECDAPGARCSGPQATTRFYVDSLHPTLSGISPTVFSPNGDHRRDTTLITFSLPDTENATVRIFRGSALVWAKGFSALRRGSHTLTWNGYHGRTRMRDGSYTVRVDGTAKINGVTVVGSSSTRSVRVDTAAPRLSAVAGNHAGFYPYRDGYRDNFFPSVTLGEPGTLTLRIYNAHGSVVRTLSGNRHAGRATIGWSGYDAHGRRAAAGSYRWTLTAADAYGNQRTTGKYYVSVSSRRLIFHSATYTKSGAGAYGAGGSADYCTDTSTSVSEFPSGIWLLNVCDEYDDGYQVASSFYHFSLPRAVKYGAMSTSVVGFTGYAPSQIASAFRRSDGDYDGIKFASVYSGNRNGTTYHLGSVGVAGHGNPVTVAVSVDDADNGPGDTSDFDLKSVSLTVHYYTLG